MRIVRFLSALTALCLGLLLAAGPALANDQTWTQGGITPNTASYDDGPDVYRVTDNRQDGHTAALQVRRTPTSTAFLCISPYRGTGRCTFNYAEDVHVTGRLCLYDKDEGVTGCTAWKGFYT